MGMLYPSVYCYTKLGLKGTLHPKMKLLSNYFKYQVIGMKSHCVFNSKSSGSRQIQTWIQRKSLHLTSHCHYGRTVPLIFGWHLYMSSTLFQMSFVRTGFTVLVLNDTVPSKFRSQFHCSNRWNLHCRSALMAIRKDNAIRRTSVEFLSVKNKLQDWFSLRFTVV